jgi:hypothetical protein
VGLIVNHCTTGLCVALVSICSYCMYIRFIKESKKLYYNTRLQIRRTSDASGQKVAWISTASPSLPSCDLPISTLHCDLIRKGHTLLRSFFHLSLRLSLLVKIQSKDSTNNNNSNRNNRNRNCNRGFTTQSALTLHDTT